MTQEAPPPPSALADFARVRAPGGRGVYASTGLLFRDAIFGRDALEVGEDMLQDDPALTREIILALARLQGTQEAPAGDRCTEEQPGRIHHEHRERVVDGVPVDEEAAAVIVALSSKWGGNADSMTYYGTIDATPLFVRLIDRYCTRTQSAELLDQTYVDKDGVTRTVREAALLAADWVARNIEESRRTSGLGLLEYQRRNPRGLEYQGWRDGRMSLMHPARRPARGNVALPPPRPLVDCGEMVNPDEPIATIETQGLAYDALEAASRIVAGTAEAQRYADLAVSLRASTFKHFWMPGEKYFATAIDRDTSGRPRQVRTLTASAAELLDTTIFDGIPALDYRRYIGGIVQHITGRDFLTPAGIRATSIRHRDQLDHVAYQGPFTVWHKQTYDIAKGLRRHGMGRLAAQLEHRILNAANAAGKNNEYLYVDGHDRVAYDAGNARALERPETIVATNLPDEGQAWTVSAVLAIKRRLGRGEVDVTSKDPFTHRIEVDALARIPHVAPEKSRARLAALYLASPAFVVDRIAGDRAQTTFTLYAEAQWRRSPGESLGKSA